MVSVIHTNTAKYGYAFNVCPDDEFVDGGRRQTDCESKLMDDVCSHSKAYDRFIETLTGDALPRHKRGPYYVFCIDISSSMEGRRLQNVRSGAEGMIKSAPNGTHMGIVEFSYEASIVNPIIQFNGDADRESFISALPSQTGGATNIGSGLRLSMNELKGAIVEQKICSTIILGSDGENNRGESPSSVIPDLNKACIRVNSIAIGGQASSELETISSKTGGEIININEADGAKGQSNADRAIINSMVRAIPGDERPISLPTKQAVLSKQLGSEVIFDYYLDKFIGRDTTFKIFNERLDNKLITLTSPDGKIITTDSPHYNTKGDFKSSSFHIPQATSGLWTIKVKDNSTFGERYKRNADDYEVITIVMSNPKQNVSPIRLDTRLSSPTLSYPFPVTITADLRVDQYPIINAELSAKIESATGDPISIKLRDDGAYPDMLAHDGVYSANIIKLPKIQRYTVRIIAVNNGTARLVKQKTDYFFSELTNDCNKVQCELLSQFERESEAGSVRLASKDNENLIRINSITDLKVYSDGDYLQRKVRLAWTIPGDKFFNFKPKSFNIYVINAFKIELNNSIDDQGVRKLSNVSNVFNRPLELKENETADDKYQIYVELNEVIWMTGQKDVIDDNNVFELRFGVTSLNEDGMESDLSNVAELTFRKSESFTLFWFALFFVVFLIGVSWFYCR